MDDQRNNERQVARQAVEWLEKLESAQPQDQKSFAKWLARSPVHVQEFLNMTAIDRYLENIPDDYVIEPPRLRSTQSLSSRTLPAYRTPILQRILPKQRLAMAAAVTLAVVGAALWWHGRTWQRYVTAIGEQRTIELADGSIVYLNAGSKMDAHVSSTARDLYLTKGEALFKVRHEATRPFRVHAQDAIIQALGTQFNVYRRGGDTFVAVLEGAVRISSEKSVQHTGAATDALIAGDEAHLASADHVTVRRQADVTKAVAWRERRLVFDQTPLPEIAAEFNRYNREPQLRIEGAAAERRRFTGAFDADDPQSLAQLLAKDRALVVERRTDEIVISGRR